MLLSIILLSAAATQLAETDVWIQLRAGRMICSNPNDGAKTCSAISRYEIVDGAALRETTEVLLSPKQPMTLQLTVKARLEKGAICGQLSLDDLEDGIVRMNGTPLERQKNKLVMASLSEGLAPLAGRTICEVLRFEDGRLLKYGQMEGMDFRLPPKPVRWITEADGFRVAPA